MATRGYGAPETGAAFARARELCRTVAHEDIFPVLQGVYLFELTRGNHAVAREVAGEILERAGAGADSVPHLVGHVDVGCSEVHLGSPVSALAHLERAVELYEAERPTGLAHRFGIEFGVPAYGFGAWSLWLLGQPDRALQFAER